MVKRKIRVVTGHLICIFLAALLLLAAYMNTKSALQVEMTSFYYDDYQIPGDCKSVYKASDTGKDLNKISRVRRDEEVKETQLYLDFREGKEQRFSGVIVKLKDSYPYDMNCSLYYQNRAGNYDFNCVTTAKLPAGKKIVYFLMPEDRYYDMTGIRVDFQDTYDLEEVLISKKPLSGTCVPGEYFTRKSMCIFFLMALFCLECFRFLLPEIRRIISVSRKRSYISTRNIFVLVLLIALALVNGAILGDTVFQMTGAGSGSFWMVCMMGTFLLMMGEIRLLIRKTPESLRKRPRNEKEGGKTVGIIQQILFWLVIGAVLVLLVLALWDSLKRAPSQLHKALLYIPFIILFLQVLLLALLYWKYIILRKKEEVSYNKAYLFAFILMCAAYLFLFLPFVSPDEPSHYLSAYRISDILLGQIGQLGNDRLLMRMEDYRFYAQGRTSLSAAYYIQMAKNMHLTLQESGYVIVDGPMVTNAVFSYFPAGIGITVARILHLSGTLTFCAGRFGNLLFFAFVLWHLMKKMPEISTALFAVSMFPMMLHMVGSFSYDSVTFCFAALFVVQVMEIMHGKDTVDRRKYALCVFYGLLLAPSKLVYVPLLALVFLIPGKKLSESPKKAYEMKFKAAAMGILLLILVMYAVSVLGADSAIQDMVKDNASVHLVNWGDHEEGYTITWILEHPLGYIVMCIRTVVNMADYYFYTMIGTKLGWLNVETSSVAAAGSFIMFFLASNIHEPGMDNQDVDCFKKIVMVVLCCASAMITMLVMALDWTPLSQNYILGVQGRYFLPLLIPGIWILRTPKVRVDGSVRKYIVFYGCTMNILVLAYIFSRYMI